MSDSVTNSASSVYQNPLIERYASREMAQIFSSDHRYRTWRSLWIGLAEVEAELGLDIRPEQIEALKAVADTIPYDRVAEFEKDLRHDVMAHIHAFGEQAPSARGIIHLGATSCFVTDNADLILTKEGLGLVQKKLASLLAALKDLALEHRELPTLAYTHFQPAQLTTLGKRIALWAQDVLMDLEEIERILSKLRFRGTKGATGTQASFLKLFDNDSDKVRELDQKFAQKMGFKDSFRVTGQTYTRKLDNLIMNALSGVGLTLHKITNDLRLLQGVGEIEEPFGKSQVGSSAMPYKRNPIRMERISSLAKLLMSETQNSFWVGATQWFERTLDDSANRRISMPHAFLACDSILILANNIFRGLVVYPKVIERRVMEELPFIAVENILLLATKAGGDRQALHECLRSHSMEVAQARRLNQETEGLLERVLADPNFASVKGQLEGLLEPHRYYGRAPEQVVEFIEEEVNPVLERYSVEVDSDWEIRV